MAVCKPALDAKRNAKGVDFSPYVSHLDRQAQRERRGLLALRVSLRGPSETHKAVSYGKQKGPKGGLQREVGGWHHPKMKHTYLMTLLIALDRFGAALVFNMTDCCISSLCWVVLVYSRRIPASASEGEVAMKTLAALKPYRWQEELLLVIGRGLEWLSPGHCVASARADILTAMRTITYLQP